MREDIAGPQGASSRPMWETLEGMVREKAQEFIQQIMEEEVLIFIALILVTPTRSPHYIPLHDREFMRLRETCADRSKSLPRSCGHAADEVGQEESLRREHVIALMTQLI